MGAHHEVGEGKLRPYRRGSAKEIWQSVPRENVVGDRVRLPYSASTASPTDVIDSLGQAQPGSAGFA